MAVVAPSLRPRCTWVASAAVPSRTPPGVLKKEPRKWRPSEEAMKESSALRKYWGGEEEDPLATDGFMWNKNFMGKMKKFVAGSSTLVPSSITPESAPAQGKESGFLSLSRASSLESLDIDLSSELKLPFKPVGEAQSETTRLGGSFTGSAGRAPPRWKLVPTRREQEKWHRAAKAATGGNGVILRKVQKVREDPHILAAKSRKQYLRLKNKLQLLTIGIGGIGIFSAYVLYSSEIAVSFGAGLLGSLVYIRMLGNSVDSMAGASKEIMKGAIGLPRILVPVILVMIYNKWNEILVPDYGLMPLDLIPMLVGFFTYKAATLVQAIVDAVSMDMEEMEA